MINAVRLGFFALALVFGLNLALSGEAEAQQRRHPTAAQATRRPSARRTRTNRPPRYLNRLRGVNHRIFGNVGADYVPTIAHAYNAMIAEIGAWQPHIARCAAYHTDFVRVASFFQVPVAFVAGIALHESHCAAGAADWAGGRGIGQLTYVSRRFHVRPLERITRRPMRYRSVRGRPYNATDHMLVAMMHWAVPERIIRLQNRRGFGILGYNMNPSTIRARVRVVQHRVGQAPTFAEVAMDLPCTRGPRGTCPREYVARVLAAALAYERYMQNIPQTVVRDAVADPRQVNRHPLTANELPGFDPALDRSFPTTITPR